MDCPEGGSRPAATANVRGFSAEREELGGAPLAGLSTIYNVHAIVICVHKVVPVHQIGTCPFVSHSKMAKKYDFTIIIICRAGLCESVHHNTLICRYGDNNMHLRYGDIHSVSLFGHPVVVLSSLAAIEEFRAASPDNFTHR